MLARWNPTTANAAAVADASIVMPPTKNTHADPSALDARGIPIMAASPRPAKWCGMTSKRDRWTIGGVRLAIEAETAIKEGFLTDHLALDDDGPVHRDRLRH